MIPRTTTALAVALTLAAGVAACQARTAAVASTAAESSPVSSCSPPSAPSAPSSPASILVESGRVAVRPNGSERSMEVTGAFSLYEGDVVRALAGSTVRVRTAAGDEAPLPPGAECLVTGNGVVHQDSGRLLVGLPASVRRADASAPAPPSAPAPAPGQAPAAPPDGALAGAATPVEGECHLKERDWRTWVRLPHRTSFGVGASLSASPHARLEVTLADGTLLRVVGPAQLTFAPGAVDLQRGQVLAQAGRQDRLLVVHTPAVRIRLVGTLMEVLHEDPPGQTTVRLHAGVAKLESPTELPGEPWATFLSAGRELLVPAGGRPRPSLRFDKRLALQRFTEGWKPEGPGESILPDRAEDDLVRQLRADQAPQKRPPPAAEVETREAKGAWTRLRMEAMESTSNRRHYQAFRRYADARTRREHAEEGVDPATADEVAKDPVAVGQTPGGQSPGAARGKLRILTRYERRTAERLNALEVDLANQDLEYESDPWGQIHEDRRAMRERLYGQDMRLQTRRLLPVTRQRLADISTQVADLSSQIRTLGGIPGSDALIRQLTDERSNLLRDADRLKDTQEELTELH